MQSELDESEDDEELLDKYFDDYFDPAENVDSFLNGFKKDISAPQQRTVSRVAKSKQKIAGRISSD
jgi:hypothetical protein